MSPSSISFLKNFLILPARVLGTKFQGSLNHLTPAHQPWKGAQGEGRRQARGIKPADRAVLLQCRYPPSCELPPLSFSLVVLQFPPIRMAGRLSLAVAVSVLCSVVSSMPLQVTQSTCETLLPLGLTGEPQTSEAPYLLMVPKEMIPAGSQINVILTGFDPNVVFESFFVEAFNAEGQPIGSFVNAPKTINCGSATAAYQANSAPKVVEMMTWEAPVDMTGTVTFRATVVMNDEFYWNDVAAEAMLG
ncbi:putative defense protein Hdd11-like isoform X1 [Penaeus chinensis]|uniref:putative defense protein Hdd11-like isoform X1 n=2 Tax=Penaeus chinensis TaxID=139456 RepID=UPI001FB75EA2|nr:putative defense protein Hdd11-like isoform X1 [Penaeus chinensis]